MKTITSLIFGALISACMSVASVDAEVNVGLSLDPDGLKEFHLAIGEHYRAPQEKVTVVRGQIGEEELPVAFILASAAGVDLPAIVKLRVGGMSWLDITLHFGLNPRVFYVPLERDPGPPYGKAYGHFKHKDHEKSEKVHMTDAEIVDWANLRFLSEYYHCSPDEVVKSRQAGRNFVTISTELRSKADKSQTEARDKNEKKEKGKPEKTGKAKHK